MPQQCCRMDERGRGHWILASQRATGGGGAKFSVTGWGLLLWLLLLLQLSNLSSQRVVTLPCCHEICPFCEWARTGCLQDCLREQMPPHLTTTGIHVQFSALTCQRGSAATRNPRSAPQISGFKNHNGYLLTSFI